MNLKVQSSSMEKKRKIPGRFLRWLNPAVQFNSRKHFIHFLYLCQECFQNFLSPLLVLCRLQTPSGGESSFFLLPLSPQHRGQHWNHPVPNTNVATNCRLRDHSSSVSLVPFQSLKLSSPPLTCTTGLDVRPPSGWLFSSKS